MHGFSVYPKLVEMLENVREDASRACYYPIHDRANLDFFLNSNVEKILWYNSSSSSSSTDGNAQARGVEVIALNGTTHVVSAAKEVILSAGALRFPGLLEYSSVGNPEMLMIPRILKKLGIPVKVDLSIVRESCRTRPTTAWPPL